MLVTAQLHGRILDQKTTAQAVNATEGRAALAVERLISLYGFPQAVLHALGYRQLCTVPHISARQLLPPDTLWVAHMLDGASKGLQDFSLADATPGLSRAPGGDENVN